MGVNSKAKKYIKEFLSDNPNNVVIIEGTNGSGKSTICKDLIDKYYYFKHVGSFYHDRKWYDPSILKFYRVHDRFKPIQDYILSCYEIENSKEFRHTDNQEISNNFINFASHEVLNFTDVHLIGKNVLYVFLIHSKWFMRHGSRNRDYLKKKNIIDYMKKDYDCLIQYLISHGQHVLVVDKSTCIYNKPEV